MAVLIPRLAQLDLHDFVLRKYPSLRECVPFNAWLTQTGSCCEGVRLDPHIIVHESINTWMLIDVSLCGNLQRMR